MVRLATIIALALMWDLPATAQSCDSSGLAVQVLGSGGPLVNRERASTGYLVWIGQRGRMLVDAGGGTFLRFGQAGGRLEDLSLLAISHLHPDHVSDLPGLLWLSNLSRRQTLPVAGPSGNDAAPDFNLFLSRLFDAKRGAFPMLSGALRGPGRGVPLDVTVVDAASAEATFVFRNEEIEVFALGVPHANTPTLAFRVQAAGSRIVFGSDQAGTDPRFDRFADGADILVMHLTLGAGETSPGHASPEVVGRVARDAQARRLVLGHIEEFDLDAAVAEVKKHFDGTVIVGADLQCTYLR